MRRQPLLRIRGRINTQLNSHEIPNPAQYLMERVLTQNNADTSHIAVRRILGITLHSNKKSINQTRFKILRWAPAQQTLAVQPSRPQRDRADH